MSIKVIPLVWNKVNDEYIGATSPVINFTIKETPFYTSLTMKFKGAEPQNRMLDNVEEAKKYAKEVHEDLMMKFHDKFFERKLSNENR